MHRTQAARRSTEHKLISLQFRRLSSRYIHTRRSYSRSTMYLLSPTIVKILSWMRLDCCMGCIAWSICHTICLCCLTVIVNQLLLSTTTMLNTQPCKSCQRCTRIASWELNHFIEHADWRGVTDSRSEKLLKGILWKLRWWLRFVGSRNPPEARRNLPSWNLISLQLPRQEDPKRSLMHPTSSTATVSGTFEGRPFGGDLFVEMHDQGRSYHF